MHHVQKRTRPSPSILRRPGGNEANMWLHTFHTEIRPRNFVSCCQTTFPCQRGTGIPHTYEWVWSLLTWLASSEWCHLYKLCLQLRKLCTYYIHDLCHISYYPIYLLTTQTGHATCQHVALETLSHYLEEIMGILTHTCRCCNQISWMDFHTYTYRYM